MRGRDNRTGEFLSYIDLDARAAWRDPKLQSDSSPWRTAKALAFSFLFITNFLSDPAHSEGRAYDWSSDLAAVDSSRRIAEECLNASLSLQKYLCIWKPVEICRKRYGGGKDNQYVVNQCAGFAASAWDGILEDLYERLMKSGAAPEGFAESQATWKALSRHRKLWRDPKRNGLWRLPAQACCA